MTEQEAQLNELEQRLAKGWFDSDWDTINSILADDW